VEYADMQSMTLYRTIEERKKINVFKVIGTTGFILTAVGFFVFIGITQSKKIVTGPVMWIGCAALTILLFASFIFFGAAKSNENNEKLTAFAITDDGKLVHLFYNDTDIEKRETIPYGMVGKVVSIANNLNTIQLINEKSDFINSEVLLPYVEGVLNGSIPYSEGKIRIAFMENPRIIRQEKVGTVIYYTVGKHQVINVANLFKSNEGYEKIMSMVESANTQMNYTGLKPGSYLTE
jgi:hypothetical protein